MVAGVFEAGSPITGRFGHRSLGSVVPEQAGISSRRFGASCQTGQVGKNSKSRLKTRCLGKQAERFS